MKYLLALLALTNTNNSLAYTYEILCGKVNNVSADKYSIRVTIKKADPRNSETAFLITPTILPIATSALALQLKACVYLNKSPTETVDNMTIVNP